MQFLYQTFCLFSPRLIENMDDWISEIQAAIDKIGSPIRESATSLHEEEDLYVYRILIKSLSDVFFFLIM